MSMIEDTKVFEWLHNDVRFRHDTDLGHLVRRIEERVLLNIPAGATQEERKALILNSLEKCLYEDEAGKETFAALQNVGTQLAVTFKSAFDTLKGRVADEVSVLSEKVVKTAEQYTVNKLGFSVTDNNTLTPAHGTYVILTIDSLLSEIEVGLKELIRKYDLKVDSFNVNSIKYFIDKIPLFQPIELDETVSSSLNQSFTDILHKHEVEHVVDYKRLFHALFSENGYKAMYSYVFGSGLRVGKLTPEALTASLGYCRTFPTFKKALGELNVDLVPESSEKYYKNIQILEDIFTICCCTLELSRQKYQEALIIDRNILNGSELEKFKTMGGTLDDITTHLRLHYNSNTDDILYNRTNHLTIPTSGIKLKDVLVALPENKLKLQKLQDEIKINLLSIRHTCTKEAFVHVLKSYINDLDSSEESGIDKENKRGFIHNALNNVELAAASLLRNQQANIEDALYVFYLNTWMKNSLVSTIYYRLGTEVITELSKVENPDETVLSKINVSVMSDILMSYLAKAFLVKTK